MGAAYRTVPPGWQKIWCYVLKGLNAQVFIIRDSYCFGFIHVDDEVSFLCISTSLSAYTQEVHHSFWSQTRYPCVQDNS